MKYTAEENKEWDELYEYVRQEIMGYDLTKSLSKLMILKLKEFRHGTIMANKHQNMKFAYNFKDVLLTFKLYKSNILNVFSYKEFKNENGKFLYALAIIKNNINDVVLALEKKKKIDDEIENTDLSHVENKGANYKKKTKELKNERLKNLW
jgi:hypothetical protein